MALPNLILLNAQVYSGTINRKGQICNLYAPFYNLIHSTSKQIGELTTSTCGVDLGLNFDLAHPVDIIPLDSFDGSVNLILNDYKNKPRLINSRFSVQENNTFLVPDHSGFTDTNLYDEENFRLQSLLISNPENIPVVTYNGLIDAAGKMKCGVYVFYFKYIDNDGNETTVQAESGIVQCHIGKTNDPKSIRFGMEDEATDKAISFTLSNIDLAYNNVLVYFTRTSGIEGGQETTTHKIVEKFPVSVEGTCLVIITGLETIIDVSEKEILVEYADINYAKTQSQIHNILLLGNVSSTEHDWEAIQRMTWKIIPSVHRCDAGEVGYLNVSYEDKLSQDPDRSHMYYNTKNVYYRVGYWPLEFYKFGIVYIFNDGSLSPVLNLPGVDFTKLETVYIEDLYLRFVNKEDNSVTFEEWKFEPLDKWFKPGKINSRGVCRMPNWSCMLYKDRCLSAMPIYMLFNLEHIGKESLYDSTNFRTALQKHDIKGYFIVRQIREPNILCLGMIIKKSDKDRGSLPLLSHQNNIVMQSFIDKHRFISHKGMFSCLDNHKAQALLSPEVLLQKPVFNDLFTSTKFYIQPVELFENSVYSTLDSHYYFNDITQSYATGAVVKLTNVNEGVKTITNGEDYFSTMAGEAADPVKLVDIEKVWNRTLPLDLSKSTTIVRGLWGSYVGMSYNPNIKYGLLCNIMTEGWEDEENQVQLVFLKLINNSSAYHAISDRLDLLTSVVECFRGDCFPSLFTHRMFRNFIDHEYPTNKTIVNPISWAQNYAVRCTAYTTSALKDSTFNNCKTENEGWFLEAKNVNLQSETGLFNLVADRFELDTIQLGGILDFKVEIKDGQECMLYKSGKDIQKFIYSKETGVWRVDPTSTSLAHTRPVFPKDILYGESYNNNKAWYDYTFIQHPEPKKTGINLIDLAITLHNVSLHEYVTRGVGNINRADVNAVSLGQWVTFPTCSSMNIAMRDIDFKLATEEAKFNLKRSFFPLAAMNKESNLADSDCINRALKTTVCRRKYHQLPDYPFSKLEFFTRVYYSLVDVGGSKENEWKQMLNFKYADYDKQYGSITKLIGVENRVYVIFQHGIGYISVVQSLDGSLELSTLKMLSDSLGSMWKDSVLLTDFGIFGVDTVAKAIWCIRGDEVKNIATRVVTKFLIDNIDLSEFTMYPYIGHINVKTHFNANKNDVIFTYYNDTPYDVEQEWVDAGVVGVNENGLGIDKDGHIVTSLVDGEEVTCAPTKIEFEFNETTQSWDSFKNTKVAFWAKGKEWSLCYNCELGLFLTFYDWIPLESANIDNIFFTFDKDQVDSVSKGHTNIINIDLYNAALQNLVISNAVILPSIEQNRNKIDSAFNEPCDVITIEFGASGGSIDFSSLEIDGKPYSQIGMYIKVESGGVNINDLMLPGNDWCFVYGPIKKITSGKASTPPSAVIQIACPITYLSPPSEEKFMVILQYKQPSNRIFDQSTYSWRDITNNMKLWKHGLAGIYDNLGEIKPTKWYGKQREFNFEFVARPESGLLGIFNNLKMISNKTQPKKFEYEIVGEGYEWWPYKAVIQWANEHSGKDKPFADLRTCYLYILSNDVYTIRSAYPDFPVTDLEYKSSSPIYQYKKLPYLNIELTDRKGRKDRSYNLDKDDYWKTIRPLRDVTPRLYDYTFNTNEVVLKYDRQLNEYRIHDELLGNDMWKYGRTRGNMQYLEDYWNIEIRPLNFKWVYLDTISEGTLLTPESYIILNESCAGTTLPLNLPMGVTIDYTIFNKYYKEVESGTNEVSISTLEKPGSYPIIIRIDSINYPADSSIRHSIYWPYVSWLEGKILKEKSKVEARHRDKYIKVKVRYTGEDLAVIQAILTIFDNSYA